MYQVQKRDGSTVEFEISKISAAMIKAFEAQNKNYHPSVINMLALQVSADFESKIKDGYIAVEDIQDSVERFCPMPVTRMSPRRISSTVSSVRRSVTLTPPCSTTRIWWITI